MVSLYLNYLEVIMKNWTMKFYSFNFFRISLFGTQELRLLARSTYTYFTSSITCTSVTEMKLKSPILLLIRL